MIWLHLLSILIGIWVTSIVWFFRSWIVFLIEERKEKRAMEQSFAERLQAQGLTSGPVYVSRLMTGREAAQAVADAKAQETIRRMTDAVIAESDVGTVAHMVDRLATYYHSDYVTLNQPWIRDMPFEQWRDIKLAEKGMTLNESS